MPRKKENLINDSSASSSPEMDLKNIRAEFAQEQNPLNHVPLALEMNKFDELTSCIKERE